MMRFVSVTGGVALALMSGLLPSVIAQNGNGGNNLNNNAPAFDFNDAFYKANGIDPGQLNNPLKRAQRFGFSVDGTPIRQTGAPAFLPGQLNWVLDNSNTDPDRNNIRILATTGGYKDDTGSPTQFISIIAFLNGNSLFTAENRDPNGVGNARAVTMQTIASNFEAYAGLKQIGSGGVFLPAPCASIGIPNGVPGKDCFSVASVETPNLRQDWRFSTNRSAIDGSANFSYNGDNLLGLWIITYHWYTAAGFGPKQTPDCGRALKFLAERNGLTLDGTPLIKTGAELHFVEGALQGNEVNDFPRNLVPTNACAAEGNLDPLGGDHGAVWLVCPSIPDATQGGIAPDAFLDTVRRPDGSPLDPQIATSFNCLQEKGQFCTLANGTYMVKNQTSGLFWDGTSPGGSVVQLEALKSGAGGSTQQEWRFTANPDGTFSIVNQANSLALAEASATNLILAPASGDASQKWILTPVNNGFHITSAASQLAVDATSETPNQGTSIVQATPNGETRQVWVIH